MQGHFLAQTPDLPALGSQPHTELRLFPGNQVRPVPARGGEGVRAHQGIATTGAGRTGWRIPFEIAHQVINGPLRKTFAAPSANHGHLGLRIKKGLGMGQPTGDHLAIAIDELHVTHRRQQALQTGEPFVARARSGEGNAHVQLDHLDAKPLRHLYRTIG
ncbi:hypothetical protein D3C84_851950 [compost metagenome]